MRAPLKTALASWAPSINIIIIIIIKIKQSRGKRGALTKCILTTNGKKVENTLCLDGI